MLASSSPWTGSKGNSTSTRRRAGFHLAGEDNEDDGEDEGRIPVKVLDEQEQEEVVKELTQLGDRSSLLWRAASLILEAACFIIMTFIPLSSPPSTSLLSPLYARSFILVELFVGSLSTLTDLVTTLPSNSDVVASSSTSSSTSNRTSLDQASFALRMGRKLRRKIKDLLLLPAELRDVNAMTPRTPGGVSSLYTSSLSAASYSSCPSIRQKHHLRLTAPLVAAMVPAGARSALCVFYWYRGTMEPEDALVFSVPFIVFFISLLARRYANDLDKELEDLQKLKYASKGA